MKINLNSVYVDDQEKALQFYTKILGFAMKNDIPMGDFRWLTVVSFDEPDGTELVLEPDNDPDVKKFKNALFKKGVPLTAFAVNDMEYEFNRLQNLGVKFTAEPKKAGPVWIAVFEDTCGNLIQIYQE